MHPVSLFYQDGRSDKVYRAELLPSGDGFVVNFAYGRRGSALNSGTKTSHPVAFGVARNIFDRLVAEKMNKGYREAGAAIPSYNIAKAGNTGVLPQLLNPVSEEDVESLLEDNSFLLQQKLDGKRLMLRKEDGVITGINRRGVACGLPETIVRSARALPGDYLIDGEIIGETYHAFDLIEHQGSLRARGFKDRVVALLNLLASGQAQAMHFVAPIHGTPMKRRMFESWREEGQEGVVFKRSAAPYIPGRPASGGDQLKFKFVATASVVVTGVNGKRSVRLGLHDGQCLVPAGNVTIPVGREIPKAGDFLEVRYLYAFPESGSLFQPVYLGVRDDITLEECSTAQLKFKPELEPA